MKTKVTIIINVSKILAVISGFILSLLAITMENTFLSTAVGWNVWGKDVTVRVTYDGNDWGVGLLSAEGFNLPSYAEISDGAETGRIGTNLRAIGGYSEAQQESSGSPIGPLSVETIELNQTVPYAIFHITWTNDEDIDITLTAPDSTLYTPSYSGDDALYRKNLAINEAYYVVADPQQGSWQMEVPDTPDIGAYVVKLIIPNDVPQIGDHPKPGANSSNFVRLSSLLPLASPFLDTIDEMYLAVHY